MASKYALLIGINYRDTSNALRGCIEDVNNMRNYLITKLGYKAENITILTDDTTDKPTYKNILRYLHMLILKSYKGATELWLHYSGHGTQVTDLNGDETDGRDEAIVPLDFQTVGMLDDDTLNEIVSHMVDTCQLTCIMDCCHSGTILDLKYRYNMAQNYVESTKNLSAKIMMLSGCRDDQTSADAYISNRWSGALTQAFLRAMASSNDVTCYNLLDTMYKYMKTNGYDQRPQISCTSAVTMATKFLTKTTTTV